MAECEVANRERDPRFPSSAWTGFFLQYWLPGRHTTDMELTWADGKLSGTGLDRVGSYTIDGHYALATGKCEWVKRYIGKHSVSYRGVNDDHGIWGVWEIRQLGGLYIDRGGFHIWPEGTDVSEASEQTEQAVLAVMREEYGGRVTPRLILWLLIFAAVVGFGILRQLEWAF